METLKERYFKQQEEILLKMRKLERSLKKHQDILKENDSDWGLLGDIMYVNGMFDELNSFFNSMEDEE